MSFRESSLSDISFRFLFEDVAKTSADGQCVVLIDKYDKLLLGDVAQFRDALKPFCGVVKYVEGKQHFTFITSISKFSMVAIFSDLSNLFDMTMTLGEATLLGYAHDELKQFFPEAFAHIVEKNGQEADWAFDEVVKWYDGYRFHPESEKVISGLWTSTSRGIRSLSRSSTRSSVLLSAASVR